MQRTIPFFNYVELFAREEKELMPIIHDVLWILGGFGRIFSDCFCFYFRKSQFQRVEIEIDQLMCELSDLEDKIFSAKVEISQWEQKKKLTLENLDILKNELEEIRHASQTEDETEPLMKFDWIWSEWNAYSWGGSCGWSSLF